MKTYRVIVSKSALKKLSKLDRPVREQIVAWMEKNLEGTTNPRLHGKPLTGDKREYWRYRVGSYRIIARIEDDVLVIVAADIAHRKHVYKMR